MRSISALLSFFIACAVTGCVSSHEYFRPTEDIEGETADGDAEALYHLAGPQGEFGEAKVWTRGVYEAKIDNKDHVLVHVAFELHNTSNVPLSFDARNLLLAKVTINHHTLQDIAPSHVAGALQVPPAAITHIDGYFDLPAGTSPHVIWSYRVHWSVSAGPDHYNQYTVFVPETYDTVPTYGVSPYGVYGPYGAYNDPYYGPYGHPGGFYHPMETPIDPDRRVRESVH